MRFGGLLVFDWYKLPPGGFKTLVRDFSRKIWMCEKKAVTLQPDK